MRTRPSRGIFTGGLIAATIIGLLAPGAALAAGAAPQATVYSPPRSFSPDGDGYEDSLPVQFSLDQAANVTVTVLDSASSVIRTVTRNESRPAGYSLSTWDGRDQFGRVAAAGAYTVRIVPTNAAGTSTTDLATAIDLRRAGTIASPLPGSTVSGEVTVDVAPASDLVLTYAVASAAGCYGQSTSSADAAGHLHPVLDTSRCVAGDHDLVVDLQWRDAFEQAHGMSLTTPVTILDTEDPSVDIAAYQDEINAVEGGSLSPAYGYLSCYDNTGVTTQALTVVTTAGALVRTLTAPTTCYYAYYSYYQSWSWDGLDDAGAPVVDATSYLLRYVVGDAAGNTATHETPLYVDRRVPAQLVRPLESSEPRSGPLPVEVAPLNGTTLTSATFYLGGCTQAGVANDTGGYGADFDTASCHPGEQQVYAQLSWTDAFGRSRNFSLTRAVTLADQVAPSLAAYTYNGVYRSGPDTISDAYGYVYCNDNTGNSFSVAVRITDADGSVLSTSDVPCGYYGYAGFTWDGRDASGALVAPGSYTATLTASDASGNRSETTTQVPVDTRVPSTLVSPAAGQAVSGSTPVTVQAANGAVLDHLYAQVGSCPQRDVAAGSDPRTGPSGSPTGSAPAGQLTVNYDVTDCGTGAATLQTTTTWHDELGVSHNYTEPRQVQLPADTTPPSVSSAYGTEPVTLVQAERRPARAVQPTTSPAATRAR